MIIRTTIVLLATFFWSCQDKRDKVSNTVAEEVVKCDIVDILDKVPPADTNYYFNTIKDNFDTKDLIFLPDSVIDGLSSESSFNTELNYRQELKSIKYFRDAYESTESKEIGFYRLLPVDKNTYNVLTAVVIGGQSIDWQILTFDKKGKQISGIDRFHELYTSADKVFGLWWYASNDNPHFETWIKNEDGEFEMILQSEEVPQQLKGRVKSIEK